jgi:sulfur-oxidizing protein SoxY
MTIRSYTFIFLSFFSLYCLAGDEIKDPRQTSSEDAWIENIKPAFFSGKDIFSDGQHNVISIKAPYKAENPAVVPISIETKTSENVSIKKVYIFIDKNPAPLVGIFDFIVPGNKTDLAMRVRVNDYSYIRTIAETDDGKFYMSKSFVKASGGCSAPVESGATMNVGKIKTRLLGQLKLNEANLMQLKIKHSNYSRL